MLKRLKVLTLAILSLTFLLMIQPYAAPNQQPPDQIQHPDGDRDGVPDDLDECPDTYYSEPVDDQGCSIRDLCPCTHPWKNDGEFVRCVARTSQDFVKAGLITNKFRSQLVSDAAKHGCVSPPPGTGDVDCSVGTPYKLSRQHAGDSLEVVFAVVGDPQLHQPYEYSQVPSDKLLRQQLTVEATHMACWDEDPPCTGVVVAGDLTHETRCKQLLAYRQLYEYGYKSSLRWGDSLEWCNWDRSLYSWGYLLNRPMYPLWGNHDNPDGGDTLVVDYIEDLVKESPALYDTPIELKAQGINVDSWFDGSGDGHDTGIYAWEWGSFHFISLGLWAFYVGGVGDSRFDQAKVNWLKNHLSSVGHEKAIVLFQHYGFDKCYKSGCSFEEEEQRWWTFENAKQLINVLCNRDSWSEPCGTPDKPKYNIAGIFSGHAHEYGYCRICPEKSDGNFMSWDDSARCHTDVDDCQVNDAGESDTPGYTMVRLNAWPKDVRPTDPYASTIVVQGFELIDWAYDSDNYNWDFHCKYDNKSSYTLHPKVGSRNPITTGFLTFWQGEPNGGRTENCAEFSQFGRMNDVNCAAEKPAACYDESLDVWRLTAQVQWSSAWEACDVLGPEYRLGMPQNLEQQARLFDLMSGLNYSVWVNYTDKIVEDRWEIPASWILTQFDLGEPNGGRIENCAELLTNGRMNDTGCGAERYAACYNGTNGEWRVTPTRGQWANAWDACQQLGTGYQFDTPQNPEQRAQLLNVLLSEVNESVWVNFSDMREEGHWETVR